MDNFVKVTKKIRKNLKTQYGNGWTDPGAQYEDDNWSLEYAQQGTHIGHIKYLR